MRCVLETQIIGDCGHRDMLQRWISKVALCLVEPARPDPFRNTHGRRLEYLPKVSLGNIVCSGDEIAVETRITDMVVDEGEHAPPQDDGSFMAFLRSTQLFDEGRSHEIDGIAVNAIYEQRTDIVHVPVQLLQEHRCDAADPMLAGNALRRQAFGSLQAVIDDLSRKAEDQLLEPLGKAQIIGPSRIVEREIAGLEDGVPAVLGYDARALDLYAEKEKILRRPCNLRSRPRDVLALRPNMGELDIADGPVDDRALKMLPLRALTIEFDKRVADRLPPEGQAATGRHIIRRNPFRSQPDPLSAASLMAR